MGEFDLLEQLGPFLSGADADVLVGHGDDAAVVTVGGESVCLAVDVLVEEVHFRRDLSSMADVGWKAVAVNCSDVAAMGGRPWVGVIGLSRPAEVPTEDVLALYEGMRAACEEWGLRLVGGDTVDAGALALSVTVLGHLDGDGVTRSGAQVGDRLVLVGTLGAAAAALAQVDAGRTPDEGLLRAHRRPRALVAAGQVLAAHAANALIDVSDGLGADLGHLCAASGVAARLDGAFLPIAPGVADAVAAAGGDLLRIVCGGGEDFALLGAVPAERAEAAARAAAAAEGVPAAVIGEVLVAGAGPTVLLEGWGPPGSPPIDLTGLGYDHYHDSDQRSDEST
ncbi:MAG: thiamine-phosphate kinase [Nitriliruptorales bacterium]|nr:thiamine-phosphate kinase [Nitriliruptorales bacterium]